MDAAAKSAGKRPGAKCSAASFTTTGVEMEFHPPK